MPEAANPQTPPAATPAAAAPPTAQGAIRSKLVAAAAGLLFAFLLVAGYLDYRTRLEQSLERRFAEAERAVAALHLAAAREFGVLDRATAHVAMLLDGRPIDGLPPGDLRRLKALVEAPVADSAVVLNFWRPDGRGILPEHAAIDLGDRDFIRAHGDPRLLIAIAAPGRDPIGPMALGAPIASRLRADVVLPVSRAIRDADGRVQAIVAATLPARNLSDAAAHQRRDATDAIHLLRADGSVLLALSGDASAAAPPPAVAGDGRFVDPGATRRYGVRAQLAPLPLIVAYTFDGRAAVAAARAEMFPEIYTTVAGLFAALCFAIAAFVAVRGGETNARHLAQARDRSIAYGERLDAILDSASDAFLVLDADFRIARYNRAAEAIFGVPAAQALGGTIDRFLPEAARAGHGALMENQTRAADFRRVMGDWRHVQARHVSGRCFPALISISKTSGVAGPSYMAIVRDMTEQFAAESRLKTLLAEQSELARAATASDGAKSLFLASMSHELRTPLNAIIGYSEALSLGYAGPIGSPKAREYVADILRSGQHLHALIDRVLDLSRVQSDDIDPNVATPLDAALRESLRFVELRALEKSIAIALRGDAAPIAVAGDPRRIVQVLLNILGNAIKFTPAGGRIEIAIERGEGAVAARLRIADTGPGISPAVLARVGKPFVQDRGLMVANNDGVGLGLSIVTAILDRLGGALRFNNPPGGGLEVAIDFAAPRGADAA